MIKKIIIVLCMMVIQSNYAKNQVETCNPFFLDALNTFLSRFNSDDTYKNSFLVDRRDVINGKKSFRVFFKKYPEFADVEDGILLYAQRSYDALDYLSKVDREIICRLSLTFWENSNDIATLKDSKTSTIHVHALLDAMEVLIRELKNPDFKRELMAMQRILLEDKLLFDYRRMRKKSPHLFLFEFGLVLRFHEHQSCRDEMKNRGWLHYHRLMELVDDLRAAGAQPAENSPVLNPKNDTSQEMWKSYLFYTSGAIGIVIGTYFLAKLITKKAVEWQQQGKKQQKVTLESNRTENLPPCK